MIEHGGGVIVNPGLWAARPSVPVGALCASTKGALETLTRAWAAEFGPQGIRVNGYRQGWYSTPLCTPKVSILRPR
jgi:NAD(P)-dependent dehydrogenase (short-subunit alcohol dehydrogenase family)